VLTSIDDTMRTRWIALSGRPILPPAQVAHADMFPSPELLKYRKELFEKTRRIRKKKYEGHPWKCSNFAVRSFATINGMNQHMRWCASCRPNPSKPIKVGDLNTIPKEQSSYRGVMHSPFPPSVLFPPDEQP
jgi:hypothetical protein